MAHVTMDLASMGGLEKPPPPPQSRLCTRLSRLVDSPRELPDGRADPSLAPFLCSGALVLQLGGAEGHTSHCRGPGVQSPGRLFVLPWNLSCPALETVGRWPAAWVPHSPRQLLGSGRRTSQGVRQDAAHGVHQTDCGSDTDSQNQRGLGLHPPQAGDCGPRATGPPEVSFHNCMGRALISLSPHPAYISS